MPTKIITLINNSNKGDDASAIATSSALQRSLNEAESISTICNVSTTNDLNLVQTMIAQQGSDQFIVIGSGSHMLPHLQSLKNLQPKITTGFAAHQIPSDINIYQANLDLIAFPKHVLNKQIKTRFGDKLIETVGVAHNLSQNDLDAEFKKRQSEIPAAEKYLLVILGGDAELPQKIDGKAVYNYYTQ